MFAANDRMNQVLIEHLDPGAWRAKPPGKVRPIVAIFTHMHNVRTKWVRRTAPHLKVPAQLNRAHCTPQEARAGLAESAARCTGMLAEALDGSGGDGAGGEGSGRIEEFRRDGLAPPWPVGVEMLCYMLAHEAHHRGQVCMLHISSDFRCRTRWGTGSGIGRSCGKSAGRPTAPAAILKGSLKGTRGQRRSRHVRWRWMCGGWIGFIRFGITTMVARPSSSSAVWVGKTERKERGAGF
jgi:uncharacterized damage-inducible protein DinB